MHPTISRKLQVFVAERFGLESLADFRNSGQFVRFSLSTGDVTARPQMGARAAAAAAARDAAVLLEELFSQSDRGYLAGFSWCGVQQDDPFLSIVESAGSTVDHFSGINFYGIESPGDQIP